MTIHFGCPALPEEIEVTGALYVEDWAVQPETQMLSHLIQVEPLSTTLTFGTHAIEIYGMAFVEVFVSGVMKEFSILKNSQG